MQGAGKTMRGCTRIFCFRFSLYILLLLLFLIQPFQSAFNSGNAQAFVYWNNDSNSAEGFSWQNGGSDRGLFGEPNLINGNILHFSPQNFLAKSINGNSALTTDRLQVDIIADPCEEIKGIKIREYGVYDINSARIVSASGAIFVTNLSQYEVQKQLFDMDPNMPISPPPYNGQWSGEAVIDVNDWTRVRIVLNNNLIALSRQGSYSSIKKIWFEIEIITPEPATAAVLTMGGVALLLCRKKNNVSKSAAAGLSTRNKRKNFFRI